MRPDKVFADGASVEIQYIRFVEAELRQHPHRKRRLATLLEQYAGKSDHDIILGTPNTEPGMPRAPGVSDPTQKKTLALFRRDEIDHLALQVRMIQETFDTLRPELQEAIEKVYFAGRWTLEGAALELGIDRKTLRVRCNRALVAFVIAVVGDWAVKTESA